MQKLTPLNDSNIIEKRKAKMKEELIKNIEYLLVLHSVYGLGPIRLKALLDYFQDPKLAWDASKKDLLNIGIPENVIKNLSEAQKTLDIDEYLQNLKNQKINWITIYDESYPYLLKEIQNPPMLLYFKGDISTVDNTFAVVGSRKMTSYGKFVTEKFTEELVAAGVVIVSGLAKGVDATAHRTTLKNHGKTFAVVGGGLNKIYPPENIRMSEEIVESGGALISMFPPDESSLPGNFPARNRIISGLSKGVLVTEADIDSGSLITARFAVEQGRDVFVVPGPINSILSKGPMSLLKEGAMPVMETVEILEALGINSMKNAQLTMKNYEDLPAEEKLILEILQNEQKHLDEICRELGKSIPQVSSIILKMEISGLVKNLGGGIYTVG